MNPKPTLQSIPHECLLEILLYVPLPECMFLRSSCISLKTAVDEHFRTTVKTLPILLSARYSQKSIDEYNQYFEKKIVDVKDKNFNNVEMSFGSTSGVLQWKMWEEKKIFYGQKEHFRPENYLVLSDMDNVHDFIDFIEKYLPNITKLALLFDHENYTSYDAQEILYTYRKQLKVLLLESTYHSMKVQSTMKDNEFELQPDDHTIEMNCCFYEPIDECEALEELYFFPKCIGVSEHHRDPNNPRWPHCKDDLDFVDRMTRKLRVVHFNYGRVFNYFQHMPFKPEVYDNIVELGCYSLYQTGIKHNEDGHRFPNLKKLVHFISIFQGKEFHDKTEYMPKLEELHLKMEITIMYKLLSVLNEFKSLKQIYAPDISFFGLPDDQEREEKEAIVNRSVELIELEILTSVKVATECFSYFKALKKVIVREPFIEITESNLQNPEFVSSLERFLSLPKPQALKDKETYY